MERLRLLAMALALATLGACTTGGRDILNRSPATSQTETKKSAWRKYSVWQGALELQEHAIEGRCEGITKAAREINGLVEAELEEQRRKYSSPPESAPTVVTPREALVFVWLCRAIGGDVRGEYEALRALFVESSASPASERTLWLNYATSAPSVVSEYWRGLGSTALRDRLASFPRLTERIGFEPEHRLLEGQLLSRLAEVSKLVGDTSTSVQARKYLLEVVGPRDRRLSVILSESPDISSLPYPSHFGSRYVAEVQRFEARELCEFTLKATQARNLNLFVPLVKADCMWVSTISFRPGAPIRWY